MSSALLLLILSTALPPIVIRGDAVEKSVSRQISPFHCVAVEMTTFFLEQQEPLLPVTKPITNRLKLLTTSKCLTKKQKTRTWEF